MFASNRSRDLADRLVRALKSPERERMAAYMGLPPSHTYSHVLKQQLELIDAIRVDPVKFTGGMALLITGTYGQGQKTVTR